MNAFDRAVSAVSEALFYDGACGFTANSGSDRLGVDGDVSPRRIVRAVLEAIREPTDAMLVAGGPQTCPEPCDDGKSAALAVWEEMLDSILQDSAETQTATTSNETRSLS